MGVPFTSDEGGRVKIIHASIRQYIDLRNRIKPNNNIKYFSKSYSAN